MAPATSPYLLYRQVGLGPNRFYSQVAGPLAGAKIKASGVLLAEHPLEYVRVVRLWDNEEVGYAYWGLDGMRHWHEGADV